MPVHNGGEAGGCFCRVSDRHPIVDYAVDAVEQSADAVLIAAGEAGGCFCRVREASGKVVVKSWNPASCFTACLTILSSAALWLH